MPQFDVFICHSFEDAAAARVICQGLEDAGLRCWIAPRNIMKGSTWATAIVTAIAESECMLIVVSHAAEKSKQTLREVQLADDQGRRLVPFILESLQLKTGLSYYVIGAQGRDAREGRLEDHVEALAAELKGGAVPVPEPAAPLSEPIVEKSFDVGKHAPADFISFAGLQYGDTVDKALDLFGEPEARDPLEAYEFSQMAYAMGDNEEPGLEILWNKDSKRITKIELRSDDAATLVSSRRADDKVNYLGMPRQKLLDTFGAPPRVMPGLLQYPYNENFAQGLLTFSCPSHAQRRCREVAVHWFAPRMSAGSVAPHAIELDVR